MFKRNFYHDRFLQNVYGSEPFIEYCESRGISFKQTKNVEPSVEDQKRWRESLTKLSEQQQADVELEWSQVNELANRESIYHLIDVCAQRDLPSDLVAGEAAQALWFLLHQPDVFEEVFFNEEIMEIESWQNAAAQSGKELGDPKRYHKPLEKELTRFFKIHEGTGRFCAIQSYHFKNKDSGCYVFIGHVSDRLQFFEGFNESGEHQQQRVRPAFQVIFAYYPEDGTILLKSRQRAVDKILNLFQGFSRSVLGKELDENCMGFRFELDYFKKKFDPSLEEDLTSARVKVLEFTYPETEGRRRVRLDTNASDDKFAIIELLQNHMWKDGLLQKLHVASPPNLGHVARNKESCCFVA